jgi:hypothetical protein
MLALEDVKVGAAHANPTRTNQRISSIALRSGPRHDLQSAWLAANKGIYLLHAMTCRS